jgi:Winged helix DNA-binding domain
MPPAEPLESRLAAQLLAGERPGDPVAVARRLLAIQAQDPRGARLAIRARSKGVAAADVDRALTEDRSLLVTWLNRGTLHLVRSGDYPWLLELTRHAPRATNARRLGELGVTSDAAERGVKAVERSLAEEGPLAREQLRERIARADVPAEGQALVHILLLASLRGLTVRGPIIGGRHAYVLVRDWLGEPRPVDRDSALAELARRYLEGHGPADARDLAKWAGLPLRDARAGLAAIAPELHERADGLVDLAGRTAAAEPPPRLLGAFDPVLLGWASREPLVGPHQDAVVAGGIFRPFALVGGRVAGVWSMSGGRVALKPLEHLSPHESAALDAEAEDVVRFLG